MKWQFLSFRHLLIGWIVFSSPIFGHFVDYVESDSDDSVISERLFSNPVESYNLAIVEYLLSIRVGHLYSELLTKDFGWKNYGLSSYFSSKGFSMANNVLRRLKQDTGRDEGSIKERLLNNLAVLEESLFDRFRYGSLINQDFYEKWKWSRGSTLLYLILKLVGSYSVGDLEMILRNSHDGEPIVARPVSKLSLAASGLVSKVAPIKLMPISRPDLVGSLAMTEVKTTRRARVVNYAELVEIVKSKIGTMHRSTLDKSSRDQVLKILKNILPPEIFSFWMEVDPKGEYLIQEYKGSTITPAAVGCSACGFPEIHIQPWAFMGVPYEFKAIDLGHELGHFVLGHTNESCKGDLAYSRQRELEADAFPITRLGIDYRWGVNSIVKRIEWGFEFKSGDGKTHPAGDARLAQMHELGAEIAAGRLKVEKLTLAEWIAAVKACYNSRILCPRA